MPTNYVMLLKNKLTSEPSLGASHLILLPNDRYLPLGVHLNERMWKISSQKERFVQQSERARVALYLSILCTRAYSY